MPAVRTIGGRMVANFDGNPMINKTVRRPLFDAPPVRRSPNFRRSAHTTPCVVSLNGYVRRKGLGAGTMVRGNNKKLSAVAGLGQPRWGRASWDRMNIRRPTRTYRRNKLKT